MDCNNSTRRNIRQVFVGVIATVVLLLCLAVNYTPASAAKYSAQPLCGDGSAPDYGFSYDRMQEHWTVGWQGYVSETTVEKVDEIFDQLNEDSIAQTMILIKPEDQVGNRVNCAVHFLRYMQLGLSSGERKDNGFVFLIVVGSNNIDVHYGVGLGLPALTAHELTDLNRTAESTYQSTHNLDQALLSLAQGFNTYARSEYAPLLNATSTQEPGNQPSGQMDGSSLACLLGLCVILLLFLVWWIPWIGGSGSFFSSHGSGGWGGGFYSGGGRGGPSMRGGGGSGRSGRGN